LDSEALFQKSKQLWRNLNMNAAIAFFQDHQIQLTDARRGNFPLAVVHEMAKQNKRKSEPRRTMAECMAIANGVIEARIVKDGGKYFISTPKLPLRVFISRGSIRALYNELHEIRDLVLAAMSDADVATKANEYKASF
jgi:hypothetical protein